MYTVLSKIKKRKKKLEIVIETRKKLQHSIDKCEGHRVRVLVFVTAITNVHIWVGERADSVPCLVGVPRYVGVPCMRTK